MAGFLESTSSFANRGFTRDHDRPVYSVKQPLGEWAHERLLLTHSSQSLLGQFSPFRSTTVEDQPSSNIPSWPKRAVIGVFLGGFCGLLYFWGPSVKEIVASVVAGAIFFSIVAVFAVLVSNKPALFILLSGLAGAIAAVGFAEVMGVDWKSDAIWGAVFGAVIGGYQSILSNSQED